MVFFQVDKALLTDWNGSQERIDRCLHRVQTMLINYSFT